MSEPVPMVCGSRLSQSWYACEDEPEMAEGWLVTGDVVAALELVREIADRDPAEGCYECNVWVEVDELRKRAREIVEGEQ